MSHRDPVIRAWVCCFAGSVLIFTFFPTLDLAVSRLFWDGSGFPAARSSTVEVLRQGLWALSLMLAAAATAGLVFAGLMGPDRSRRCFLPCACLFSLFLIGPGLIANGLLKSYWGRARPDQTEVFGGTKVFTAALSPADQCSRNCSFVSGEAASALALAVSVVFLARWLRPDALRPAVLAAIAIALLGGGLRLVAGRHFLSDVIFAWLIVGGLALLLDRVILRAGTWNLPPRAERAAVGTAAQQA